VSDSQTFGDLVDGTAVERAVIDHLQRGWLATGLAVVERRNGLAPRRLQLPRSYVSMSDVELWPEDQLPSVLVLNTGLAEPPVREEDGSYSGKFALGCVAVCSARDRDATDQLSKWYAAALRGAIMWEPTLGGFARSIEWVDEDYDPLDPQPGGTKRGRQLAGGYAVFRVQVDRILTAPIALTEPPDDPYAEPADWPTVKEDGASVEIQPTPIDQEL
jgi:hypothetical protein